jgi:hypothetical protein
MTLNRNGLEWHHIVARWYCDHSVASMSHRGHHTSPLLLSDTVATTIRVISPGVVATKGHNSDIPISLISLTESETSLHKYLLTSSALRRCLPQIDNKFLVFLWETSSFFMQLSKMEMRLPISPTLLAELGRSHVKNFYTNIYFVQHRGESSPHQSGYHILAGWFHITIEPDANREYSGLWGQFLHNLFFKNDICYFDR